MLIMAPTKKRIKLSELAFMSEKESVEELKLLFQAAVDPSSEQIEEQKSHLDSQIQAYELQYGMTSSEMKEYLASGDLKETHDLCSWLMLLKIRGRFDSKYKSP